MANSMADCLVDWTDYQLVGMRADHSECNLADQKADQTVVHLVHLKEFVKAGHSADRMVG